MSSNKQSDWKLLQVPFFPYATISGQYLHSEIQCPGLQWGCQSPAHSQSQIEEISGCHCNALLWAFCTVASSPSPEQQDAARPSSKNPLTWTVEDVVWFVKDADPQALGPHVELFRKHVCKRLPLPPLGNLSHKREPGHVTQRPSTALGFLSLVECRIWQGVQHLWRVWAKEISLIPWDGG